MRKDAGTYGDAQRLEQLGWMLFLKILDDHETEQELLQDHYRSPLPAEHRWRNWAGDEEGITGDALLGFINNSLLPALKSLTGSATKIAGVIRMVFQDANNYMKNGTLMRQVVNKINAIDFNASDDRHMFGDIYEQLLRDLQSAGNAGEFYTPRAVTQFIVEQVNPQLGESILDPACGTGGFLVCAIEHLRKQAKRLAKERSLALEYGILFSPTLKLYRTRRLRPASPRASLTHRSPRPRHRQDASPTCSTRSSTSSPKRASRRPS